MNSFQCTCHGMALAIVVFAGGCALIISGRTATVQIDSNPSDAQVVIRDKHNREVLTTRTPATVELRRKDHFIWPARYLATIKKPGYKSATVPIDSTINPWILGNVVFGGVIGLAVDNTTGAAWKPRMASVERDLEPICVAQRPRPSAAADQTGVDEESVEQATAIY